MNEINSGEVILYIDGKPITACSGVTLTVPFMSCTEEVVTGDLTFTCEELVTPCTAPDTRPDYDIILWNYNYYMAKNLPRKQKKAYRKKLIKMLYSNINQSRL